MNREIQALACCSLLLAAAEVFGQEIKVIVADGKNGHAVRNAVVWAISDAHLCRIPWWGRLLAPLENG